MKKTLSLILTAILAMAFLTSCGGKKVSKEDINTMEGKWNLVLAEMYDVKMTPEDAETQMSFEFKGNKTTFNLDGETETYDWEKDDTIITIWIPDGAVRRGQTAVLEDNYFTLYRSEEGGTAKLIFAKEGTDAENIQNYISDDDITMEKVKNTSEEDLPQLIEKLSPEALEAFGLTKIAEELKGSDKTE